MKKRCPIIFLSLFAVIIISIFCGFAASAATDEAMNASYAPGGKVTGKLDDEDEFKQSVGIDQLIEALGGSDNAEKVSENTVRLKDNIRLEGSVVIYAGSYKIIGGGCTIYRGCTEGAIFHLVGSGLDTNAPSLTLGKSMSLDNEDLDAPELIISGNKTAFTKAVYGPLIALSGQVTLTVNPGIKLVDNYSSAPGGAVFMESLELGNEYTPLAPKLYITGGEISGNVSAEEGGAIAIYGDVNGNSSGYIQIDSCTITGNYVENEDGTGKGGAIYSNGGGIVLNGCKITSNSADLGGAIYTDDETILSGCTFQMNRANVSGGFLYATQAYDRDGYGETHSALVSLISVYAIENSSLGEGGAITCVKGGKVQFTEDTDSYICENTSVGNGAVIYNEGTIDIADGDFYYNESSSGFGGIYNLGIINFSGGDVRCNTALSGGGLYNLGTFNMTGGYFESNKCSIENAPQIVSRGAFIMSDSFVIEKDIIGLIIHEDDKGDTVTPNIELTNIITTNVKINVAFYREKISDDGNVSYFVENAAKLNVYSGSSAFLESAITRTEIYSLGFGSYTLNSSGSLVYNFPLMPVWAWVICVLVLASAIAASVIIIKRRKGIKSER